MEEAAQILEIETFIPLLLQVNMYDVPCSMTNPQNVMSVIFIGTILGQLSLRWADWWGSTEINGACHW